MTGKKTDAGKSTVCDAEADGLGMRIDNLNNRTRHDKLPRTFPS